MPMARTSDKSRKTRELSGPRKMISYTNSGSGSIQAPSHIIMT